MIFLHSSQRGFTLDINKVSRAITALLVFRGIWIKLFNGEIESTGVQKEDTNQPIHQSKSRVRYMAKYTS